MLLWLFQQDNTLIVALLVEPFLFCEIINCPYKTLCLPNDYPLQHQTRDSSDNGNCICNNKKNSVKIFVIFSNQKTFHLPPPPRTFTLIIVPIHVQSLDVAFNAPQFPNHLTCRQLHPRKSNDPSITHYLTPPNHASFFYDLHFNSKEIILSTRLPP